MVTTYNGEVTTVRDQANKQRRSTVDGIGRLKMIEELFETGGLYATTSYGYDARGNLRTVSQGAQSRTFNYDGLSRLTSAFNPESGSIGYQYDSNSNLTSRTDARNITTQYFYDSLNRVTSRSYSDGTPTVNYGYDTAVRGVGRLASVAAVGVSTTNYTEYDRLGRVTQYNQVTGGQAYFMSCAYNKAGLMTSETYPSQKVALSEYDGAGRLAGVKNQATGSFYAGAASSDATNRMQYSAHGAMTQMRLGNGLWEHTNFNSRLQPTQIGLGTTSTSTSVMGLDYGYGTTNNNGNILTQTINAPGMSVTQSYTYDHLNRLKSATESGAGWQQTYDYDRYGNRAVLAGSYIQTPGLTPQSLTNFNTSNNRINLAGFTYDGAGNLTSDPTTAANAMAYDGENRQVRYTKGGVTTFYDYDGDGRRVKKEEGSGTTVFVYNARGQLVAEYATNAATGPMVTSYLTTDHLGSTRVVTKQDGSVKSRRDYLPFGEEIGAGIGSRTVGMGYSQADGVRQQFTSKERDSESGLDYFLARYYSSGQGRFTSADSFEIVIGASDEGEALDFLSDPRSWNKYAYTYNNPLRFVDPDGQRPQDSFHNRFEQIHRQRLEGKISEQQYWEQLRGPFFGGIAGLVVGGGGTLALRSPMIGLVMLWAARNPDKAWVVVQELVHISTGSPAPGAVGTLTISTGTRLTAAEISTGARLAKQTGTALVQSEHVGAEFVDAAGKTYDAMGGVKAFQNFGNGANFFKSIVRHVNKSVDRVAIDLKGASQDQIKAIKEFVSGLTKKQQERIIYVNE